MGRDTSSDEFAVLDPFDKSRCSFPVPEFASDRERREWSWSLTPQQRFELLHLMLIFRYGEDVLTRPMEIGEFRSMTMGEFNAMKEQTAKEDDQWRIKNGIPLQPWRRKAANQRAKRKTP